MISIKLSNYNKRSHVTFKLVGDIALFAIPMYLPIILSLPISDTAKLWTNAGLTFVSSTIKIISKFTADDSIQQDSESPKQ